MEIASKAKIKRKRTIENSELFTFSLSLWFLLADLSCPHRLPAFVTHMCLVLHITNTVIISMPMPHTCIFTSVLSVLKQL